MKVKFFRHPESLFNIGFSGPEFLDSPLSSDGIESAISLVMKNRYNVNYIYHADNFRCSFLANLFFARSKKGCRMKRDSRLNEKSYGIYEGMNFQKALAKMKRNKEYSNDPERMYFIRPTSGESYHDVEQRLSDFLDFIRNHHTAEDKIFCITGQDVLRVIKKITNSLSHKDALSLQISPLGSFDLDITNIS